MRASGVGEPGPGAGMLVDVGTVAVHVRVVGALPLVCAAVVRLVVHLVWLANAGVHVRVAVVVASTEMLWMLRLLPWTGRIVGGFVHHIAIVHAIHRLQKQRSEQIKDVLDQSD